MIIDIDTGYKDLQSLFGSLGAEISVDAGVLDDPEVARYAAINEFGAPNNRMFNPNGAPARIPERPAFRSAFDTHEAEYVDEMNAALAQMVDTAVSGGAYASTLRSALDRLGIHMAGDIRVSITSGPWDQNSEATVGRKGFDHPLIETGRLAGSITHKVTTGYLGGFGQDRAAPVAASGVSLAGEVP